MPQTSVGFDALNISLGIGDLDHGGRDQILTPAAHVVVKVNDAKVVIYGEVIQDGHHGLHRLRVGGGGGLIGRQQ